MQIQAVLLGEHMFPNKNQQGQDILEIKNAFTEYLPINCPLPNCCTFDTYVMFHGVEDSHFGKVVYGALLDPDEEIISETSAILDKHVNGVVGLLINFRNQPFTKHGTYYLAITGDDFEGSRTHFTVK